MMSLCVAPSARRTPISRVRSVTVASMMFMMPMPPTTRLIAAIDPSTTLKICRIWSACRSSSSGTTTSKSFCVWYLSSVSRISSAVETTSETLATLMVI